MIHEQLRPACGALRRCVSRFSSVIALAVLFACASPSALYADGLGRFKRSVLRDCNEALRIYREELRSGDGNSPESIEERTSEIVRYLAEVFRLNMVAALDLPLAPGNLADPADIWRSLSGESDTLSKRCALTLTREIGRSAVPALASATVLLSQETSPPELRREIVNTVRELVGAVPLTEQLQSDQLRNHGISELLTQLSNAERDLAERALRESSAARAQRAILLLRYYAWDPVLLGGTTEKQPQAAPSNGAASTIPAVSPATPTAPISSKARRAILQKLAAPDSSEREKILSEVTADDTKLLEGIRTTGSRTERVAAALALAHRGGEWSLDSVGTKNLDCTFAESFVPFAAPKDLRKRDDVQRLVARCLLVGRERFMQQLLIWPEILRSDALAAVLARDLAAISDVSRVPTLEERLSILALRVASDAARAGTFETQLRELFSDNTFSENSESSRSQSNKGETPAAELSDQ